MSTGASQSPCGDNVNGRNNHLEALYIVSEHAQPTTIAGGAAGPGRPLDGGACAELDFANHPPGGALHDDWYATTDDREVLVQPDVQSEGRCEGSRGSLSESRDARVHRCHEWHRAGVDKNARNRLIVVTSFCAAFMIAEILGGIFSHSLALVTDATHMASDVISMLISLLAVCLSGRRPSSKLNFGFYRAEVLGALLSVLIIWLVTGVLVYMAVQRAIGGSYHIHANEMLILSAIGVVFNMTMGFVLHSGMVNDSGLPQTFAHHHSHDNGRQGNRSQRHTADSSQVDPHSFMTATGEETVITGTKQPRKYKNINLQAAFIHILGDCLQSLGILTAAIVIKVRPDYKIADPVCTFVFSCLVLVTTSIILREVINILMEAKPRGVDYGAIQNDLRNIDGVMSVHSLSVWSLTISRTAAVVHVAISSNELWSDVSEAATVILRDKYGIQNTTIQIENYLNIMDTCTDCHVE